MHSRHDECGKAHLFRQNLFGMSDYSRKKISLLAAGLKIDNKRGQECLAWGMVNDSNVWEVAGPWGDNFLNNFRSHTAAIARL